MPPMRKVELDKAAWAWCNDIEPENITEENIAAAYRLNVIKCGFSKCRRNCRGNPFCLNGLGESKWMSDPVEELDDDDLDIECRKPESFVGLRNLGATCYINSLLQLWFHNIAFRNPILRWNPQEDLVENSAIAHLQFLFTLMQFGRKKSVDPSDFVTSLEIDVSLQQDAREFSQLFISYLEDYLKRQSDPVVRNLVNNNFQGHYNYVTRCSKCNTDSIRESTFYELEVNVKGHRTLDESIAEFLKEEKLEGDDMYKCCVCQSKQEATRHIELTALPPVLNIQLIRFIYDRQKGMKKKLNTPLQFPETLDMGPYLKKNKDNPASVKYNLFAVLIHKGTSANSGHYVAHICDQTSGNWYMFNDENTQKIEGKKLKLNSDEDYEVDEGGKKQKSVKAIKGYLSSSNAYMLVYTAGNSGLDKTPINQDSIQEHLKTKLQEYNETFDSLISQSREEKRTQLEDENLMKAEMASFLSTLPVGDNEDWEAISIKWLTNWISANRSTGFYPVDNKHFTCPHDKINPSSIKEFKFINKGVANNIYDKYGGGPRLGVDSLCRECVTIICQSMRAKSKIANDQKELNNLIRAKEHIEPPAFWVGKLSLRTWKAKALKLMAKPLNEVNGENKDTLDGMKISSPCHEVTSSNASTEISSLGTIKNPVNCNNNEVTSSSDKRKIISSLSDNIDKMENGTHEEERDPKRARNSHETNGEDGNTDNEMKQDEVMPRKRFKAGSDEEKDKDGSDDGKMNGNKTDEDDDEDYEFNFNEDLICPHGNLCVKETSRRLIPEAAWTKLKAYFPDCKEFSLDAEPCLDCQCLVSEGKVAKDLNKQQASKQKELLGNLYNGKNRPKPPYLGSFHVISVPDFLEPWRKFIREPTRRDPMTSLKNSKLICPHDGLKYNPLKTEDFEKLSLVTDEEWDKLLANFRVDVDVILEFRDDEEIISTPEVCVDCVAARIAEEQQALLQYTNAKVYIKQVSKITDDYTSTNSNQQQKDKTSPTDGPIRRSSRNKRRKMEKIFKISSDQTLLNLKLEILNWLGVAPYDQHLFLEGGKELTDHQSTLASLSVFPDSVILLQVDEPGDESSSEEGIRKRCTTEPEHGFKGTGLLKR